MQLRRSVPVVNNEFITNVPMESEEEWHQKAEEEELFNKLEDAVKELSAEQRQCIELFYLQRMCYNDISAQTGLSPMQVKSAIQNGRRNLKLKLEASRNVRS